MDRWYGKWGSLQAEEVNDSSGKSKALQVFLISPIFLSRSIPSLLCFSLGAWQHPSRWRVYFCFCLFTYSCIQLFGASQGLLLHHRMQIATAANPLSSLPCGHPASPHVLPGLLQSRHLPVCVCEATPAVTRPAKPPPLASTSCMGNATYLSPFTHLQPFWKPSSHSPHPHSIPRRFSSLTLAPKSGNSISYTSIHPGMKCGGCIHNWVWKDMSWLAHSAFFIFQFHPSRPFPSF